MATDYQRRTSLSLTPEEIVRLASGGDREAETTLVRYEDRMARALGGIINVLDPDVIVLGGGLSNIERLYEHVPRLWAKYVFGSGVTSREVVKTSLLRAHHGDSSGVRGAAWLWGQ
jgi:predicted NBD/HSP70 family sugar kinase